MTRLVMCPRPFSTDRIEAKLPEGLTVSEMILAAGINPDPIWARVFIDDRLIEKAQWDYAKPAAGQLVTVRVVPMGGGGDANKALRLVGMIAVMAVAIWVTGGASGMMTGPFAAGTFGAGAAGLATSIIGSMEINRLISTRSRA